MKIVYLGSGEFGIDCLNALVDSSHSLEFIVTGPVQPAGRGRRSRPTAVARWANTHSIPFIEAEDVNAPAVVEKIAVYKPELIIVIAFGQKISNELITLPPFLLSPAATSCPLTSFGRRKGGRGTQESTGAINVHASLLPKYRGAAPVNWAIINGERQTGISIITLAEKMDAGDILAQLSTEIRAGETAGELHDRLAKMAALLLLETVNKIADGTAVYRPQNHSKATSAPKLKKSDGFLDFNEPAEALARKILGFWPWPGASAYYVSKRTGRRLRVTIAMAETVKTSSPAALPAGTLDDKLNVVCGKDGLKITKIKPAGSSVMGFTDFANGRQTRPDDLFIKIAN